MPQTKWNGEIVRLQVCHFTGVIDDDSRSGLAREICLIFSFVCLPKHIIKSNISPIPTRDGKGLTLKRTLLFCKHFNRTYMVPIVMSNRSPIHTLKEINSTSSPSDNQTMHLQSASSAKRLQISHHNGGKTSHVLLKQERKKDASFHSRTQHFAGGIY